MTIPYEPRRFRSAAQHYAQGRPPYAPKLFHRVAELSGLEPRHAILDLGCGPGQIALGFAPMGGSVTAMDPEPEMLALAAQAAKEAGAAIRCVAGSSYDLSPALGRFRLVAIGRAFHWMDRNDTLIRLDAMIEPEGAVVLFGDRHPPLPENRWLEAYNAVLDRFSADDSARRARKAADWPSHEAVLMASPFSELERIGVIERQPISIARLEDRMLSLSSVSRDRIGDRAGELVAELRAAMADFATDGTLQEVVESQALIARRPAVQ